MPESCREQSAQPGVSRLAREIDDRLRVTPGKVGFDATLTIDGGLSVMPDHFADAPVLPGVCLAQAVLRGLCHAFTVEVQLAELKNAKFFSAAVPGETVEISAQVNDRGQGDYEIKSQLRVGDRRVAQITLHATAVNQRHATSGD